MEFAEERITEINPLLEEVGIEAEEINIAKERLEEHASRATEIISEGRIRWCRCGRISRRN